MKTPVSIHTPIINTAEITDMWLRVALVFIVLGYSQSNEYGPLCKCKHYRVYTDQMYWTEAALFCELQGGLLAKIPDKETDDSIRSYILDSGAGDEVSSGFWIGLNDRLEEGIFKWLDGEELSECGSYTNWASGEPNNNVKKDPEGQDCVQLMKRQNFKWDDDYCQGQRRKGVVCQFNVCDEDVCSACIGD
ncbi:C-type lectin lectoxin-Phi1-like isoform X2 [Ptychodera flava]|uniref:C-type lectin lectoxin-Phi1-like isoform X2 n=1 Tax=Ptychodera flava TaxID=63121 RepID=UPI00396A058E